MRAKQQPGREIHVDTKSEALDRDAEHAAGGNARARVRGGSEVRLVFAADALRDGHGELHQRGHVRCTAKENSGSSNPSTRNVERLSGQLRRIGALRSQYGGLLPMGTGHHLGALALVGLSGVGAKAIEPTGSDDKHSG